MERYATTVVKVSEGRVTDEGAAPAEMVANEAERIEEVVAEEKIEYGA